jgi:sortase A
VSVTPITGQRRGGLPVRFGFVIVILAAIAAVLAAYPFAIGWSLNSEASNAVAPHVVTPASNDDTAKLTDEKRLLIPSIGVDSPIIEGADDSALDRGAWLIPGTSTPDQGGNTVISGHRFKYLPPNNTTFYLLDKLKRGDDIEVQWNEKLYHYRVTNSRDVQPEQVEILDNTTDARLTLFTCTPILSTARRLVVTAELVSVSSGV